jgi:hypothetical protein
MNKLQRSWQWRSRFCQLRAADAYVRYVQAGVIRQPVLMEFPLDSD